MKCGYWCVIPGGTWVLLFLLLYWERRVPPETPRGSEQGWVWGPWTFSRVTSGLVLLLLLFLLISVLSSCFFCFFFFSTFQHHFVPLVFPHPQVPLNQVLCSRFSGRFAASKGAYFTEKHSEHHQADYAAPLFLTGLSYFTFGRILLLLSSAWFPVSHCLALPLNLPSFLLWWISPNPQNAAGLFSSLPDSPSCTLKSLCF